MSSNCPPQLQLSIQSNTSNFKRSFEEFGFDLESPVGSGTDAGGGSGVNDRSKRARSSSSFSESSDSADDSQRSSVLTSASDSSSTSNSSLSVVEEPPVISNAAQDGPTTSTTMRASSLDHPPRLPTPTIQDIDMTEVLPETLDTELVAPQQTQQRHQQVQDRYRLSLERFNAFENEISILRRSQPSLNATRSPTPPPTLPPLSVVSSSSSSSSLHPQTHIWSRSSQNDVPFLHHLPTRTASPLTEHIFADVGEGSSGTHTQTENSEVEDTEQVSDEVLSGPHFGRIASYPQFQNRTEREGNVGIEEEIEVVHGFRERLNSALERLRSTSPLVPELEEVVRQAEGSTEQDTIEDDSDEESTGPTPSLSADPPTLPPIPPISVDEWAHPVSFLSHNRGLSSSSESSLRPMVPEQSSSDLDISQDRIRRQTYMQRFIHMRRHQQQRILEMQQYLRSSRPRATDATTSNDNQPFNLSDHSLPSPMLRDLRHWLDERPPIEETSTLRGISSGLSPRTDPPITASQSTDGNINQEQRQPSQPSHVRPTMHSHTSVDSGTWRFVNSLFIDQANPLPFETELFNGSSSLSPTGATTGSSEYNPPSTSTPNSNSDTPSNSGSVSYSRNLTDEAAVRSLDHGIGMGLGFVSASGTRSVTNTPSTATPRRSALVSQQVRNLEERRERPSVEGSGSTRIERLRILSDPHEDFRLSTPEDLDGTFPDPDLDFLSLAGAVGSTTSSPSLSSEWDFLGADISPVTPSSPGIHRLPDFLNPTMSSLDFLSPTAAATAPSNLPVNIRHLWGESPRNPRQPPNVTHHDHSSQDFHRSSSRATTSALSGNNIPPNSNGIANASTRHSRLRRDPQPRHDIRNLFRSEETLFSRNLTDYADLSSSTNLNSSSSSRVPTAPAALLNRLNAREDNASQINSFQRPRLRSFHLQTRPGSSTSLVGENAAEVRRREERARLRTLMDNSGTERPGNSNRSAAYDVNTERVRPDGSDQVSTTRPSPSAGALAASEGMSSGTNGGMRSRPTFDTVVQNAWRSIHGLDIPDSTPDDETSTVSGSAMNRLFGTRETGSTAFDSSSISSSTMDTTDATRNNTNDEDVNMLGENEDEADYENSLSPFNLDSSDGYFLSWLNFNTERSAPRSSTRAEAAIRGSTEGPSSFNRDLDLSFASGATRRSPFWNQVPRETDTEGSSTATRRRRYSDLFEPEPRSDSESGRPANETSNYLFSDFVPSLPSPDLGGSFEATRPSHSTHSRSGEPHTNPYDLSTTSTHRLAFPSPFRIPSEDRANTRPPFQVGVDGDARSRPSLWATLTREPTRDSILQPSYDEFRARRQEQREDLEARLPTLAQLRTHIQEQRARIEELRARSPSLLPQNDRHNINPTAYAPGPFRNTLQHRLDEQTFARYMQSRREQLSPSNSSNPPTIPPLSFGDDNLTSLSGSIPTPLRPSDDVPTNSTRDSTRRDRVLPHPNMQLLDNSPQARYTPQSYASARTANQHDVNRELLHSHHFHHFRPDDHPIRPPRDVPSQTNVSPSRNSELNAAQARHGLHPLFRHRPRSADARPAANPPPSTQNTRLPQPPILRAGAGYGRYIALSPHLMHAHSPEDATSSIGQAQASTHRRIFPAMSIDDETDRGGHPAFARGRRARPHSGHPHETMFMFGRYGHLRRARALGDFMRDEDFDESYESLLSLAQTLGDVKPKSTPAEIIEKLEKGQYKDWATAESDQRCPICLDDYEQTDTVLKLNNCPHWLHQDCLHQWLQTANTCPVCRKSVTGTTAGTRPRGQAHQHHHHRNNPFSGPSTSFRHHAHAHNHAHAHVHAHPPPPPPHPRRQRSSSNSNPNTANTSNAAVPPPLPLPSSQHLHSPSNPNSTQGNGGNHDDNAPWRRAPRD